MNNIFNLNGAADPDFLVDDTLSLVMEHGQVITLPYSLYQDNLIITNLDTDEVIELSSGTFEVVLDQDSIVKTRLIDPVFEGTIIRQLVVKFTMNQIGEGIPIKISGYAFRLPHDKLISGAGPLPTPGLMSNILTQLSFMVSHNSDMDAQLVSLLGQSSPKAFDPVGNNPLNHISGEAHFVRPVGTSKGTIIPSGGDFYTKDFRITSGGVPLIYEKDYKFGAMNVHKMAGVSCVSPIYATVHFLGNFVGEVILEYRAVGGTVTLANMEALSDSLTKVINWATTAGVVTTANLDRVPTVINLDKRLTTLESKYGVGIRREYNFKILDLPVVQWYDIGEFGLDHNGIMVKTGKFLLDFHYGDKLKVTSELLYDLSSGEDRLALSPIGSVGSPLSSRPSVEGAQALLEDPIPMIRAIYLVDDEGNFIGGKIQVGLRAGVSGEHMCYMSITNNSATHEGFILTKGIVSESTSPDEPDTNYPSNPDISNIGTSVWNSEEDNSKVWTSVIAPVEGILLWEGAEELSACTETTSHKEAFGDYDGFVLTDIRGIELSIEDTNSGNIIVVNTTHNNTEESLLTGSAVFYPEDRALVRYTVYRSGGTLGLSIKSIMGTESEEDNRFTLLRVCAKL